MTLACGLCKKDVCRPADKDALPSAIRLLTTDPDKYVRGMAAELVGKAAHTSPKAVKALEAARNDDPSLAYARRPVGTRLAARFKNGPRA